MNNTYTINAETHPSLFNLLTITEVCDCDVTLEDVDSGSPIHLGDLINAAREELGL